MSVSFCANAVVMAMNTSRRSFLRASGGAALFDAGRTLKWDADKAAFADSPAANSRLSAERIF